MDSTAVPKRHAPPAMLVREACRDGDTVRPRTRAKLTAWAPERIDARRRALQGACDGFTGEPPPSGGPLFAGLLALTPLAERLGLLQVRGAERWAKLVLWLLGARVAAPGSRLSAVRWATQHAVAATLGWQPVAADDLDAALDRLAEAPEDMAAARSRRTVRPRGGPPTGGWSAVTSAALEGEHQALAACGYRRDRQPGPAQRVLGLWTTAAGEPVAVPGDEGTTADPVTVPAPGHPRRTRLGSTEVGFVGDRGRVTANGPHALTTAGCRSITALTTAQGRRLLQTQGLRPAWGPTPGHEVVHGAGRWSRRRREALRQHAARRRADQWATRPRLSTARHPCVRAAKRAQPATGLRTLQAWGTRPTLAVWGPVARPAGRLLATLDPAAQAAATVLEGCAVVETEVPPATRAAQAVPDRERDRQDVAPDFRPMPTGRLAVRPLVVRQALRTRAPVVVTRLALHVVRERRRALVAACGTTADDTRAVTGAETVLAGARLWLLTSPVQGPAVTRVPTPDARQPALLDAWGTP